MSDTAPTLYDLRPDAELRSLLRDAPALDAPPAPLTSSTSSSSSRVRGRVRAAHLDEHIGSDERAVLIGADETTAYLVALGGLLGALVFASGVLTGALLG